MISFNKFRAAFLAIALITVSSAAFGQGVVIGTTPDGGEPAKTAVSFQLSCSPAGCTTAYSVPKGHRLVVTQISATVNSASPVLLIFGGSVQGVVFSQVFILDKPFQLSSAPFIGMHSQCNFAMDSLLPFNSSVSAGTGFVNVSGHLVKM